MARHTVEDTRRELLDAASVRFTSTGLRGTSLADIAKEAGYSKATVLYHFESKEQLLRAWSADLVEALLALDVRIASSEDVGERQEVAARGFVDVAIAHRQVVRLLQAEISYILGDGDLGKDFAVFEKRLRTALTRENDTPQARVASVMFIGGVTAVVDQITDLGDAQVRALLEGLVVSRLIESSFDTQS